MTMSQADKSVKVLLEVAHLLLNRLGWWYLREMDQAFFAKLEMFNIWIKNLGNRLIKRLTLIIRNTNINFNHRSQVFSTQMRKSAQFHLIAITNISKNMKINTKKTFKK